MRTIMLIAAGALLATGAQAQLLGEQVAGGLQGRVGGVGQLGAGATGAARVDPTLPDVRGTADAAIDGTTRTASRAARRAKTTRVDAGASVRVARGERCYYDDGYHDPVYRDGYYYCERTSPSIGVAAGARVKGG